METPTAAAPEKVRKPPKETKGEIDCPTCDNKAALIKKTAPKSGEGKLYIDCDGCGLIMPTRQRFQDYVLEHGRFYGPNGEPAAPKSKPTEAKKAAAAAASTAAEPPKAAEPPPPPAQPPKPKAPATDRDDI